MADRGRRTGISRVGSVWKTPTTRRAVVDVPTPPTTAEIEAFMLTIEEAVRACILRHRWEDLSAAVTAYAALLRLDPSHLLLAALIRPKAREALTLTDLDEQRYYAEQIRACIELGARPMSLAQAIANVRSAVEHRPAFDAFDKLGQGALPGMVH